MFRYSKAPGITEYSLSSEKLPKGSRVRLAIISDLHDCEFGEENRLLYEVFQKIKPDAIVIPGDLIDAGPGSDPVRTLGFLKKLHNEFPHIYYAPGNHERKLFDRIGYTRQMMLFKEGLPRTGVSLMRNEKADFLQNISFYGLDLNHGYYRRLVKKQVPLKILRLLLGKPDPGRFNILIAHDPDHFPEYSLWKPDLVISGHVHGGIIRLPKIGGLISPGWRLFPKYSSGFYDEGESKLLVSRGAGSHTINVRINNPPEILSLDLSGV